MLRILVVAMLAGCGKSKSECAAEVADLMAFLRSFDHSGTPFQTDATQHVTRAGLPAAKEYAPSVIIDAMETSFGGRLLDDGALAESLVSMQERIRDQIERHRGSRQPPPDPRLLYFQISERATWARVVTAVRIAADAGFTRAGFVFLAPAGNVKSPPRTWVDDEFEAFRKTADGNGAGNVATKLAQLASDVIKSCPAMKENFGRVGSEEGDKAELLIAGTEPALIDCNCKVDMAALRSIWWLVLGNPTPTGVLELAIDKTHPPLALPASTLWRDASKKLERGNAWLVSEP